MQDNNALWAAELVSFHIFCRPGPADQTDRAEPSSDRIDLPAPAARNLDKYPLHSGPAKNADPAHNNTAALFFYTSTHFPAVSGRVHGQRYDGQAGRSGCISHR
ncbi:hypothetical protein D3C75_806650 [compost metagenome]